MRRAGAVVAEMHERIRAALRPGVTTAELDAVGREVLDRRGATSNFLGYHGFPAVICASPNDVVIHGIPDATVLEDGDVISVDCGAIVDGWHGDAAFTAGVGTLDPAVVELIANAEASLAAAIREMRPGCRLGDLGHAVQTVAEGAGYGVVREYVGHGIGREMHLAPDVPNYGRPGKGMTLRTGHVLAIEPMITAGSADTYVADDGWTVRTADGSVAVHVEHTVAVTDDGPLILTAPQA